VQAPVRSYEASLFRRVTALREELFELIDADQQAMGALVGKYPVDGCVKRPGVSNQCFDGSTWSPARRYEPDGETLMSIA
jgi:hypothetical protein